VLYHSEILVVGSEARRSIPSSIDFVSVTRVAVTDGLPEIADRKGLVLQKLVDVTKLVQEELGVQRGRGRKENCFPKRNCGRSAGSQRPASNANRQAAPAILCLREIGVLANHRLGEVDSLSHKRHNESGTKSHLSPFASTSM